LRERDIFFFKEFKKQIFKKARLHASPLVLRLCLSNKEYSKGLRFCARRAVF
jgi:hypothetical protein